MYFFTALYLIVETELNLDPDLNPDPESDPELLRFRIRTC
jgi:hypothetical protein